MFTQRSLIQNLWLHDEHPRSLPMFWCFIYITLNSYHHKINSKSWGIPFLLSWLAVGKPKSLNQTALFVIWKSYWAKLASYLSFISFYAMTSLEEMLTNAEIFCPKRFYFGDNFKIRYYHKVILQFYLKLQKLLLLGKVCKFTKFQGKYKKRKINAQPQ